DVVEGVEEEIHAVLGLRAFVVGDLEVVPRGWDAGTRLLGNGGRSRTRNGCRPPGLDKAGTRWAARRAGARQGDGCLALGNEFDIDRHRHKRRRWDRGGKGDATECRATEKVTEHGR